MPRAAGSSLTQSVLMMEALTWKVGTPLVTTGSHELLTYSVNTMEISATLFSLTRRWSTLRILSGTRSLSMSSTTVSTLRPATPPAALRSSAAISRARLASTPSPADTPVSGKAPPMVTGLALVVPPESPPESLPPLVMAPTTPPPMARPTTPAAPAKTISRRVIPSWDLMS